MIAKHIPMRFARRSSFRELVAYITHTKDKEVRVGAVRVTNCHQDDAADAALEVLAVQLRNHKACSDKTYHLLISFDATDNPSPEDLKKIEAQFCEALGFGEHQRVSAVHTDTDNLHIHVAINKIHPVNLTIHNPYCDYKTLGRICQRLEQVYGLARTNHETIARGQHNAALNMEHAAGVESLLGWIRRECLEELRQAQGWAALHQVLGRNGLVMREQGNGLIVSDQEGRTVKASSIARDLSKAQLVKRFGPFEPDGQRQLQASRSYQPRPMLALAHDRGTDELTNELWRRYQADQAQRRQARNQIRLDLRQAKHGQMKTAKDVARIRRGLIRGLECDRLAKRILYHQAGAALREDMQSIHERHQEERERKLAALKPMAWFDWLAQRAAMNDEEALGALRRRRLRAARRANCLVGIVRQDRAGESIRGLAIDGITKQGTIIYPIQGGKSAIRDSGSRLEVSEGITQEGLEIALVLAAQRYGKHLIIEGDTAFQARILHTAKALGIGLGLTNSGQRQSAQVPDTRMEQRMEQGEGRGNSMPFEAASPGEQAARRYIAERESKRQKIAGIPKHVLGELGQQAEIRYAGWRRVDGQLLLLARSGIDEITVMPANAPTIARVSGARLGEPIRLDGNGLRESRGLRR